MGKSRASFNKILARMRGSGYCEHSITLPSGHSITFHLARRTQQQAQKRKPTLHCLAQVNRSHHQSHKPPCLYYKGIQTLGLGTNTDSRQWQLASRISPILVTLLHLRLGYKAHHAQCTQFGTGESPPPILHSFSFWPDVAETNTRLHVIAVIFESKTIYHFRESPLQIPTGCKIVS